MGQATPSSSHFKAPLFLRRRSLFFCMRLWLHIGESAQDNYYTVDGTWDHPTTSVLKRLSSQRTLRLLRVCTTVRFLDLATFGALSFDVHYVSGNCWLIIGCSANP
ncbi:hypothetical protein BDN67DRAFT_963663 [Paxillus ammoniavirescens]|nr:hypothetical protein BDN67DRAFT_963663 [Paxillus ammoniavirescens]